MLPEFFLESHYYDGGLRHRAYASVSERPAWAPAQDAVGFQDEFPIGEGDGAVELRRFEIGNDQVTWLGVYFPSVDAKLGDRRNHAGVGVWLRNALVIDASALLFGLRNLAEFIAKNPSGDALAEHAMSFLGKGFLPEYLQDSANFPFARGMPFGPTKMVKSNQWWVSCPNGIGECRALSDFVYRLLAFDPGELEPRALILVTRAKGSAMMAGGLKKIPQEFDGTGYALTHLPEVLGDTLVHKSKLEEVQAQLKNAQTETERLRQDHAEQSQVREDPWRVALERIDRLSMKIDAMENHPRPTSPNLGFTPPPLKKNPVSGRSTSPSTEPEYEVDWVKIIAIGVIIVAIPVLAYLILRQVIGF